MGKPEGVGPLRIPRRKGEDNIKRDLQDLAWVGMDWIDLAQNRDKWGGSCECGNETSVSIKCGEFLD